MQKIRKILEPVSEKMRYQPTNYYYQQHRSYRTSQTPVQKKLLLFQSVKKCLFLRNLTKISNVILCFSKIIKILVSTGVKQVTFLSEDWKKLSSWSSVLFTVFALEILERKAYIKQTRPNVSVLLHTLSHDYLQIFSLSNKPNYLRSALYTFSLFQCFNDLNRFSFWHSEKG